MILSPCFPQSNYLILSSCSSRNFFSGKHYGLCKGKVQNAGGQRPNAYFSQIFCLANMGDSSHLCNCIVYLHCVFTLCIAQILSLVHEAPFACILCIFVCVFHRLYFCVVYFKDFLSVKYWRLRHLCFPASICLP